MGCSTLHIKTEIECRVFLFDEEKGIAKPGSYFNLEVRKGEQDLLFVSTNDETLRCPMLYNVEENDCDYRILLEKSEFKQYSQDFLETMRLAERGDAEAQYNLGEYYYDGDGVEQDYQKAVEWYAKAAEQVNINAQIKLGECYYYGRGVEENEEESMRWYRKAAEQGDCFAQNELGMRYKDGRGVRKNYSVAVKWFRKAAEQGETSAQFNLGYCYKNGQGVDKDYQKALEWFTKSAEQGNACAQYNLGTLYKKGNGVDLNYTEALKWYCQAATHKIAPIGAKGAIERIENCQLAEQGDADAQYKLGKCYYNGYGVERDYYKAAKWYAKSAEQGNAKAQYFLGGMLLLWLWFEAR